MRGTFILIAILANWPISAMACSPASGEFDTPSNFELVNQAELIVLARVGEPQTGGSTPFGDSLPLLPIEVLKGTLPAEPLVVGGTTEWNGKSVNPIVTPLTENHFSAGLGACMRMFYQPGEMVLAILEDQENSGNVVDEEGALSLPRYFPHVDPSSRSIETVAGSDDIWVEAVRLYIEIADGSDDSLRELKSRRDTLRTRNDFAGNAIANDITRTVGEDGAVRFWRAFNTPAFTMAFLVDLTQKKQISLVCASEQHDPAIVAPEEHSMSLRIGESLFETERPEVQEIPSTPLAGAPNQKIYRSKLSKPEEVFARLTARHEDVAVLMDGEVFAHAPPGDVLLRWTQRCKAGFD